MTLLEATAILVAVLIAGICAFPIVLRFLEDWNPLE